MGLIDFFNRLTWEPRAPDQRRLPYQPRTQAGVTITPDNTLTVPALLAGVRYLKPSSGTVVAGSQRLGQEHLEGS